MAEDESECRKSLGTTSRSNREIREKYRHLKADVEHRGTEDPEFLNVSMNQVENYFENVQYPREAVYDSSVVNLQSKIINQKAQTLHTNLDEFVPQIFVDKLRSYFKEKRNLTKKTTPLELWKSLGYQSFSGINSTPPFQPLYGTFEPGTIELKKRTRKSRTREELSDVVQKPISVDPSQAKSVAVETTEKILSILKWLYSNNESKPLCYFEFVVNPSSFSETVENMFYVSILVNEAFVHIYLDDDKLPVIEPILEGKERKEAKLHGNFSQSVLSISFEDWKGIIRDFGLEGKPPLITTRRK